MRPGERWIKAWNSSNKDELNALYAEDIKFRDMTLGVDVNPQDLLAGLFAAFPDLVAELREEHDGPDFVVVEWVARGTHTGPFLSFGPTGRKVEWNGVDVMQYRGDRIAKVNTYWDMKAFCLSLDLELKQIMKAFGM